MNTKRNGLVVLFLATQFAACGGSVEAAEGEDLGTATQAVVKTAYERSGPTRRFYALSKPKGSYVLQLTWKSWNGCNQTQKVMTLLPASETTWSVCAALGLGYETFSGGVKACVTQTTKQPTPVYYYKWVDALASEVNYRILDRGTYDYDTSGWLPSTPGNGCTRPQ